LNVQTIISPRQARDEHRKKNSKRTASAENDKYEALLTYGIDLVESAQRGALDPVIGREEEIRR
jgi:ATP-dependent Clp protease ATP-binding subunit ClpA